MIPHSIISMSAYDKTSVLRTELLPACFLPPKGPRLSVQAYRSLTRIRSPKACGSPIPKSSFNL